VSKDLITFALGQFMGKASISVEQWEELAKAAQYRAHALAGLRKVTTRQLRRQFNRDFGCSPQEWLNVQRIALAERLLLAGQPIKAVAFELGFKQPSHFCRVFKATKQMTPSEFVGTQTSGSASQKNCQHPRSRRGDEVENVPNR
jgi:AraC-like DNA-binding protein